MKFPNMLHHILLVGEGIYDVPLRLVKKFNFSMPTPIPLANPERFGSTFQVESDQKGANAPF